MTTELYAQLNTQALQLKSRVNQNVVLNLIGSGAENAWSTINVEKAAPESEWEYIFKGSIASLLSTGEYSKQVVAWFAKRGIQA